MARASPAAVVAVLLLASPLAWAVAPADLLSDAGSGGDAGDSREAATPLAYGGYVANMTPFDADWYALPSTGAVGCLALEALGEHTMRVVTESGSAGVAAVPDSDGVTRHVLAVGGDAAALVGFEPDTTYLEGAASVGAYSFGVARAPPSVIGDGPTRDAPDSVVSWAPVAPADCFGGRLDDDESQRDRDVFAFSGDAGAVVEYSLALARGSGAYVEILAANGTALASPVPAGAAGTIALPSTGTFYVRAASTSAGDDAVYALALLVGPDPPGSGCKPTCMLS